MIAETPDIINKLKRLHPEGVTVVSISNFIVTYKTADGKDHTIDVANLMTL